MESSLLNIELLDKNNMNINNDTENEKKNMEKLLSSYGIKIACKDVVFSLNYIIYKIDLKGKYKIKDLLSLQAEIGMHFENIEEVIIKPIPETNLLGIFLKKFKLEKLFLGTLMDDYKKEKESSEIPLTIGMDMNGEKVVKDLYTMPHMLISGTTGSGKTTLLDCFIIQLLYKFSPDDLKLILIDTRGTSFAIYNKLPYLLTPTITEPKKAISILQWTIEEMKNRYKVFSQKNVRDLKSYNEVADVKIPRIVIIVDDFADIVDFVIDSEELQKTMSILSQEARASGIHMIISTFRPSTEIMKGLIKSNIPCRLSLKMATVVDSTVVINEGGAEKLNKGEALLKTNGYEKAKLIEVPFVSNENIHAIVNKFNGITNNYNDDIYKYLTQKEIEENADITEEDDKDPLLMEAIETVIEIGQVSTSFIQRRFKIGYARSGRIIDQMEKMGIVSGYEGSKPRKVIMPKERWEELNNADCNKYNDYKEDSINKANYNTENNYEAEDEEIDEKRRLKLDIIASIIIAMIILAIFKMFGF